MGDWHNECQTFGDVAQLGEHHVRNVGAEGSNPFISTKRVSVELYFVRHELALVYMFEGGRRGCPRSFLVRFIGQGVVIAGF